MKILLSMLEHKLKKFDEDEIQDKFNIWNFYKTYSLVGPIKKIDAIARNRLWKRYLKGDKKAMITLRTLVYKDRHNIENYKSIEKNIEIEQQKKQLGNLWSPGRWAIASFQHKQNV